MKESSEERTGNTSKKISTEKSKDASAFLPLLGILLLATPLVSVFTREELLGVIPNTVFYVFGVWLILIGLASILSRYLNSKD